MLGHIRARKSVNVVSSGYSRIESSTMMLGRSIAMIGVIFIAVGGPAAAQVPAPADREAWGNEQAKPSERAPPTARPMPRPQPRAAPPARTDEEFDPPPPGCQFRENKLDLLV